MQVRFALFVRRGGGIRTPGSREGSPVFETGAISRSATPLLVDYSFDDSKNMPLSVSVQMI